MDKYETLKCIGEGAYGIVYKAIEKSTKQLVAIKQFKLSSDDEDQIAQRELQLCSRLNHPNIVSLRDSYRRNGSLHLVFDFVENNLLQILKRHSTGLPHAKATKWAYELCKAIQYCHSNNIIHRDIKPENILIDAKGKLLLCDFGVARVVHYPGVPLTNYVATRWYRSPEQELRYSNYSFSADVWSVGCIVAELFNGQALFPGESQIDQINKIQALLGPLPSSFFHKLPTGITIRSSSKYGLTEYYQDKLPKTVLDFLNKTLVLLPGKRMDIKDALNHPLFRVFHQKEQKLHGHQLDLNKRGEIEEDIDVVLLEEETPVNKNNWKKKISSEADDMTMVMEDIQLERNNNSNEEDIVDEIIQSPLSSPSSTSSSIPYSPQQSPVDKANDISSNRLVLEDYEDDFEN